MNMDSIIYKFKFFIIILFISISCDVFAENVNLQWSCKQDARLYDLPVPEQMTLRLGYSYTGESFEFDFSEVRDLVGKIKNSGVDYTDCYTKLFLDHRDEFYKYCDKQESSELTNKCKLVFINEIIDDVFDAEDGKGNVRKDMFKDSEGNVVPRLGFLVHANFGINTTSDLCNSSSYRILASPFFETQFKSLVSSASDRCKIQTALKLIKDMSYRTTYLNSCMNDGIVKKTAYC